MSDPPRNGWGQPQRARCECRHSPSLSHLTLDLETICVVGLTSASALAACESGTFGCYSCLFQRSVCHEHGSTHRDHGEYSLRQLFHAGHVWNILVSDVLVLLYVLDGKVVTAGGFPLYWLARC